MGAEASLAASALLDSTNREAAERELWAAQSASAALVSKLASHERALGAVANSNLVPLLTSLLKSEAPLELRDNIAEALLTLNGIEATAEVVAYDTIPHLVSELGRERPMEAREEAVGTLRDLALLGQVEYVGAIAAAGGIFPLVELLQDGTPPARDGALAILYHLSNDEENIPALMSADAPTALRRIVKEGAGGLERWKLALFLLRRLPV